MSGDVSNTIENYLKRQRSHDHKTGYVYYDTPVFYEDFSDKWRAPSNKLVRFPQRIDVKAWQHHVPEGVPWAIGRTIFPSEITKAFFEITRPEFDRISETLGASRPLLAAGEIDKSLGEIAVGAAAEALEKKMPRGQGFQPDSRLRRALEDYAMGTAEEHFRSLGYAVKDDSKEQPYDLKCTRRKTTLFVEVKGTQTRGECVILTSGEVEFARRHKRQMALFIVHSILVSDAGSLLKGGRRHLLNPWDVDEGHLKPIAFKYDVPGL